MNVDISGIDKQDIRIAVVMSGGVSLAIWISGVTLELHHVAQPAKRTPEYRQILDKLLNANARIDVIAGTSAGGLNGTFLALGLAAPRDLGQMRDLWKEHGDLRRLLRHPLAKNPPSLLQGDDYFIKKVEDALATIYHATEPAKEPPSPVELILTGTLWEGRLSTFTDDMGANIVEQDYDATFRFTNDDGSAAVNGNLDHESVIGQLAKAARCTSSFPGAFEPHWVEVAPADDMPDGRWPSSAGRANFSCSQFVVDGGVLLNKPLRPALEAIYRQPAERQVRRVLAYVCPTPSEPSSGAAGDRSSQEQVPNAREVVLDVFTRLRSTESVSRELEEIRCRSEQTGSRRRARDQLAGAMTERAADLAEAAWDGYREVRVDYAARTIADLIFAGQTTTEQRWSKRELVEAIRRDEQSLSFVPRSASMREELHLPTAEWGWGPTAVQRLGNMGLDVMKRAVWLAPLSTSDSRVREEVVAGLQALHDRILTGVYEDRRALDGYWSAAARGNVPGISAIPRRSGPATGPARNQAELDGWLAGVIPLWKTVTGPSSEVPIAQRLHEHALALARQLRASADAIESVCRDPNRRVDPHGHETARLTSLYRYLLAEDPDDEEILNRLLRLDVVQLAFGGATGEVEQQVELVQVSSRNPGHLTGLQAHHFGAFYRPSWRMNDWMHGRLDGASHIVRILLSPERIRQLGTSPAEMLDVIREIAVPEVGDRDHELLALEWENARGDCLRELTDAADPGKPLPKMLAACTDRIARRVHTRILREDLPGLADAIRKETGTPPADSRTWLSAYETKTQGDRVLPTAELWSCWHDAERIGDQRIHNEVGDDTLAQTATHTAAVASSVLGTRSRSKIVGTLFRVFRGYTLIVWAMVLALTAKGNFAKRAMDITIAAGGTLLATVVLLPSVPLGLILAGIVLILAGATSAALCAPDHGARRVGLRLLAGTVIAVLAVGLYSWATWHRPGAQDWEPFAKFGVAILLIGLGLFVARTGPRR
ncbi:patatin-like protein [Nonomuraea zeae]|uniref:Patatin-like protein n=1 Tax=Nonomuraea zeae TaxID=1642303 RepID=A0A5S4GG89_9ACTN|nr:patatin-like protein [Nonomuraea zeae]TMR31998.1 patatin-like protein [Nonomuraea zeae]